VEFSNSEVEGIYKDWPILKPAQIPARPPSVDKTIADSEIMSSPHRVGIIPPIVEPTKNPSQISFFELMLPMILPGH
jgi:hypothetical protein